MSVNVSKIIAIICYWFGIDNLFYYLNRNKKRIITFHNVMPKHLLPNDKRIGLTDTEEEFEQKINEIGRKFKFSTDLTDVRTATITFDDGYRNQKEIAGAILAKHNIRAIIFTAGKILNSNRPENALIVDLLMHWVELAPNGIYSLGDSEIFNLTDYNRLTIWQTKIWPAFNQDVASKGWNLLNKLDGQCPIVKVLQCCSLEYLKLRLTGLSDLDIDNMQKLGWVIGWHTESHFPLSRLSPEEQRMEIASRYPCFINAPFSFPYGELNSVNELSIDLAKECGYPCAVSNLPNPEKKCNNFFLPRYMLDPNKYMLHFELSGVKHFLKTWCLLPSVHG